MTTDGIVLDNNTIMTKFGLKKEFKNKLDPSTKIWILTDSNKKIKRIIPKDRE